MLFLRLMALAHLPAYDVSRCVHVDTRDRRGHQVRRLFDQLVLLGVSAVIAGRLVVILVDSGGREGLRYVMRLDGLLIDTFRQLACAVRAVHRGWRVSELLIDQRLLLLDNKVRRRLVINLARLVLNEH